MGDWMSRMVNKTTTRPYQSPAMCNICPAWQKQPNEKAPRMAEGFPITERWLELSGRYDHPYRTSACSQTYAGRCV